MSGFHSQKYKDDLASQQVSWSNNLSPYWSLKQLKPCIIIQKSTLQKNGCSLICVASIKSKNCVEHLHCMAVTSDIRKISQIYSQSSVL